LVKKTIKLAKDINAKTIMISGGVSANQRLRSKFIEQINDQFEFLFPDKLMSTDNAVMMAIAGYYDYLKGKKDDCLTLEVDPNEEIKSN
jgi:N6-L-threonylcarbamoyladenine synthase